MKKRNIICVVVLFIIIICFALVAHPDVDTVVSGVLTSLIASFLFLIFTLMVDNSSDEVKRDIDDIKKHLQAMSNDLKKLETISNDVKQTARNLLTVNNYIAADANNLKNRFGIIKIEHRKEYSYDFWAALLNDALTNKSKQFVISGKTLHRWLEAEIVDTFRETLLELITRKTKITFVIYKNPSNSAKKEALKTFLCENVYPHLINTCGKKLKDINKVFSIYEVDSLPYLYTAIDSQMVVAQYFNSTSNSENIMLVLSPKCTFACRYRDDFNHMIQGHLSNNWITDFLQQGREPQK